jgi:VWFA-related protein
MLTSQGLRVQPAPSKDGNGMAAMLDSSAGTVRARDFAGGVYSLQEQFQDSMKALSGMTENLSHRPGRKVVIWLGPGWPLLTERFFIQTNESRPAYFRQLATLENSLLEARITIYSLYTVAGITPTLWQGYVKPVRDAGKMEIGYMALQVLAEHTGGRVLPPSNDVKSQIDQCVAEIGEYYTIAFMPPATDAHEDYHDLKVTVNRPGTLAKTFSGYYNEPAAQ